MAYRHEKQRGSFSLGGTRREKNRANLKRLVDAGNPPGLIGYQDGNPIGWISIGPREEFHTLQRSPVMKPVDEKPVWSIVCYVIPSEHRRQGVATALLQGAIAYARTRGASLIEAYPMDRAEPSKDTDMWFGSKSMYDRAGFQEVARRKPERPIVRLQLRPTPARKRRA